MSLKGMMTGRRAYKLHGDGKYAEAMKLYEEAYDQGMGDPRFILGYTTLLLREGQYAKAREILVALQKTALNPTLRNQMMVNYAAAVFRMGEIDKGIRVLEGQHRQGATGLVYQTLGYLYVEKYAQENEPDFDALEAAAAAEPEQSAEKAVEKFPSLPGEEGESERPLTVREKWQKSIDEAEAFIRESIDYDEVDSICLDNLAQFLYRVRGDKAGAREWFDKALAEKENQIDTLWFLSRYDLEAGRRDKAVERIEKILEGRFSPLNYVNRDMAQAELERLRRG